MSRATFKTFRVGLLAALTKHLNITSNDDDTFKIERGDGLSIMTIDASGLAKLTAGRFYSAPQTFAIGGGGYVLPHGMAGIPLHVTLFLKCIVAEAGFSVGDVMVLNPGVSTNDAAARGFIITVDATNINVQISNNGFSIARKDTGANFGLLTAANWQFIIGASA